MRFDPSERKGNKLLGLLYNASKFFVTYAELDGFEPCDNLSPTDPLDQWRLERLHQYLAESQYNYSIYEFVKQVSATEQFVDEVTNWYIRLSRHRVWNGDMHAQNTLFVVLLETSKAMAPMTPFASELMY